MNLAGYQDVIAKDADTALKVNISWHFFFPASSTTPWQLDGVIQAMKTDGYDPKLIHACHNRTVVIDAHLGERENKQIDVVRAHALRNVHLYEGEDWIDVRDAVGDLTKGLGGWRVQGDDVRRHRHPAHPLARAGHGADRIAGRPRHERRLEGHDRGSGRRGGGQ